MLKLMTWSKNGFDLWCRLGVEKSCARSSLSSWKCGSASKACEGGGGGGDTGGRGKELRDNMWGGRARDVGGGMEPYPAPPPLDPEHTGDQKHLPLSSPSPVPSPARKHLCRPPSSCRQNHPPGPHLSPGPKTTWSQSHLSPKPHGSKTTCPQATWLQNHPPRPHLVEAEHRSGPFEAVSAQLQLSHGVDCRRGKKCGYSGLTLRVGGGCKQTAPMASHAPPSLPSPVPSRPPLPPPLLTILY